MGELFVNIHHSYEPVKMHNLNLVKVQTGQEEASREFIFVWRIVLNWFKNQSRRVMLRKEMQFSITNWRVVLNFGHMLNYDDRRTTDEQLGLSSDIINGAGTNLCAGLREEGRAARQTMTKHAEAVFMRSIWFQHKSFTPLWCLGWYTTLKSCSVTAEAPS